MTGRGAPGDGGPPGHSPLNLKDEQPGKPVKVKEEGAVALRQELVRGTLAYLIFGLVAALMIGYGLIMLYMHQPFHVIQEFIERMLGPLIALLSAATGYYFGSKASEAREILVKD
jgi:hypothetical protein